VYVASIHRMLSSVRVLWSFHPQPGCWYPAVGIVLELRARGHEVVGLSDPSVGPVLGALGIELRMDGLPPWPAELGSVPAADLDQALRRKVYVAAAHRDHVARLLREERFDMVLADGFRLGAGFAADAVGVPWASYTHHQFDDRVTSEGLVQMWWDRFPHDASLRETFVAWWRTLRAELEMGPEPLPESVATWWNQSPHATLVLGLPELLGHTAPTPAWVHHVGPSLWDGLPEPPPAWLDELGPAVLVALSAGTDEDVGTLVAAATAARERGLEVVATLSAPRELPALPDGVRTAIRIPHGAVLPRVRAVVATGGLGTVTRVASVGLPAVLVPRANDQFLVAEAAVAAGMAVRVLPGELDAGCLGRALDCALTDHGLAAAAAELRRVAARYDGPSAAADVLESLTLRFSRLGGTPPR
jgi:UDP:flavonoid glycosyltransferase YjiC (YdhE family)